jgi:hypothetical protein
MNSSPHYAKKEAASDQEAAVTSDLLGTRGDGQSAQPISQPASVTDETFDPVLSRMDRVSSKHPQDTSLTEIVDEIRSERHKEKINQTRSAFKRGGKAEANKHKDSLPAVLFAGRFQKVKDGVPQPHSGLIVADFDHLGNSLDVIWEKIIADRHVVTAFISPTGSGIKAVFRCDPKRPHADSFSDMEYYCSTEIGAEIDPSGKNVNRQCFLSHDPRIFLNRDAITVPPRPKEPAKETSSALEPSADLTLDVSSEEALGILSLIDPNCSRDDWIKVGMGLKHQLGASGFKLWDSWSQGSSEKYPGQSSIRKQWDSLERSPVGKKPVTFRTIIALAKGGEILLPGGAYTIKACADKLFSLIAKRGDLFFRGGAVQEVIKEGGAMKLHVVDSAAFQSRIESYGRVMRYGKGAGGPMPATCPRQTAEVLLKSEEARTRLPNVELLSSCPILMKAGGSAEIAERGWHSSGVFVTGGDRPPDVPLADAIQSLKAILSDFAFAAPGDFSRALAAIITPAMCSGGWIDRQPLQFVAADYSQTGKGYFLQCVAAVYRECPQVVTQRRGGVGGVDESIDQRLIEGRPFILLDNWRGMLDSPRLEALITAPDSVGARVPHRGEIKVDPRRFVFQMTSNGVRLTEDLTNRALIISLKKRPPGYQFKIYPEGDLVRHIRANQPFYLGCVFSIVRAWASYGEQRNGDTGHSFGEWLQKTGWIVDNLLMTDPLLSGMDEAVKCITDPNEGWLRRLVNELAACSGKGGSAKPLTATELAEVAYRAQIIPPGVRAGAGYDPEGCRQKIGQILKEAFGDGDELRVTGRTFRRNHEKTPNGDVRKTYEVLGE